MKKILMIYYSFLPVSLFAQWTGTNPGYFTSGNIGIGVTAPAKKLEVSETGDNANVSTVLRLSQGNTGNPQVGSGSALEFAIGNNFNAAIPAGKIAVVNTYYTQRSKMVFATKTGDVLYDRMVIDDAGNVGVGVVSPAKKLEVAELGDNANVSTVLRLSQTNTGNPQTGSGSAVEFAIGNNFNPAAPAGKISVVNSYYTQRSKMVFTTKTGDVLHDRMVIDDAGNVGVGVASPAKKLEVAESGDNVNVSTVLRLSQTNTGNPQTGSGSAVEFAIGNNSNPAAPAGKISVVNSYYTQRSKMVFTTKTGDVLYDRMVIDDAGNVGIGTTSPDAKLAVNGTIHSKEVKVDLNVPAPDYVFEKDYNLLSLDSIKTYIDQHKHLPEVPSAKEMEANGVNLGEMNMVLLKKMEEMTLYMIELKKENEDQNKIIEKLLKSK